MPEFAGFNLDDAVPENPDDVYEEPDNNNAHVGGHARSAAGMGLDEIAPGISPHPP